MKVLKLLKIYRKFLNIFEKKKVSNNNYFIYILKENAISDNRMCTIFSIFFI